MKFIRHAKHRKKKLEAKWRRPKGLQNKLRLSKKSRGTAVDTGYRRPAAERGLTSKGKKAFLVSSKRDINEAEPEQHVLIIARVGDRRRLELLEEAEKQGFAVQNHDPKARAEKIKSRVEKRGEKRKSRTQKREELRKKAEGKKKQAESEEKSADEKKAEQKKEQDKVLTKKEA